MSSCSRPEEVAAPPVLVVDDEAVVLEALTATLSAEGYQVAAAAEPTAALDLVQQQEFALVLTDQRMPGMTGLELLARIRQLQPDTTRVLMTGVLDLATVIDCINQGELYRFLVKPWLREELLATVQNGVQRYGLLRHNARLQRDTQAMNEQLQALNRSLEQQLARQAEQKAQLAELNHALERNLHRSVELCLQTMQTFYPRLGLSARRVHELACVLAEGLRLSPTERQVLEIAAWLHDIGLVGVPRRLIRRWHEAPAQLNRHELALIQQHPVLGQELAGFVQDLASVGKVIRAHHERFDGQGYPDALLGDEIPWLARLLAVLVGYAEAELQATDAVAHVEQEAGRAFDPEAVRLFLQHRPHRPPSRQERTLPLSELAPGMVLAKGIYTASGLLLAPEGQTLSEPYIAKLRHHNRLSPLGQSITVYC